MLKSKLLYIYIFNVLYKHFWHFKINGKNKLSNTHNEIALHAFRLMYSNLENEALHLQSVFTILINTWTKLNLTIFALSIGVVSFQFDTSQCTCYGLCMCYRLELEWFLVSFKLKNYNFPSAIYWNYFSKLANSQINIIYKMTNSCKRSVYRNSHAVEINNKSER